MEKSIIVSNTGGGGNEPQGGQGFLSKIPFFKNFSKSKFSVSDKNNFKINVGWGFHPNKNNEFQELTNCHPELVSGSSHHQKCVTICTVSGKEVLDKVGWAFSPTMKLCWGRNPNLQKADSTPSKAAFTLAEVLITLGIIGVVAAMTLPTLIAQYEKNVVATRVKQTYSMITQAIKLSEVQNGELKYWDNSLEMDDFLEKYIFPYLKGVKLCGEGNSADVTAKCGSAVSVSGKSYTLPNGVNISVISPNALGGAAQSLNKYFLAVLIDVNSNKRPNFLGYDTFYFQLNSDGFFPYGYSKGVTRDDIFNGFLVESANGNNQEVSCKKSKSDDNDALYRHGCTMLLMIDGWEIKDDYPW